MAAAAAAATATSFNGYFNMAIAVINEACGMPFLFGVRACLTQTLPPAPTDLAAHVHGPVFTLLLGCEFVAFHVFAAFHAFRGDFARTAPAGTVESFPDDECVGFIKPDGGTSLGLNWHR